MSKLPTLLTGGFSAFIQSPAGSMRRIGSYRIVDEKTIVFIDDPAQYIQVMSGSYGRPVSQPIHTMPGETNYYQFLNPGAFVLRASIPPYNPMTYHRVG